MGRGKCRSFGRARDALFVLSDPCRLRTYARDLPDILVRAKALLDTGVLVARCHLPEPSAGSGQPSQIRMADIPGCQRPKGDSLLGLWQIV